MPGGLEDFQTGRTEVEYGAIAHGNECIVGFRSPAEVDRSSRTIPQLEVSCDKICMEVGQEHVLNLHSMTFCIVKVLCNVTLGIDNRRDALLFIGDQIRCVSETTEIILLEDHSCSSTRYTLFSLAAR